MSWNPGYDPTTNHYQLAGTSYDASGNVTNDSFNAYASDPYNKMLSVNSTACGTNGNYSTYDAFGRIVEFSKNTTYKENWYTQAGTVVMSGTTLAEAYLQAPGGGSFMELGGQNDYLHKDWLGNARIGSLIGSHAVAADMAYAPYGEVYNFIAGSGISQMFTGDLTQLDSEVLFDTPNRELAASNQGRWLSPDPAGAGWNQYAYATNPNSSNDPSGLHPINGYGWQVANGQGPMDWAAFGLDGGFGSGGGGGAGGEGGSAGGTVGADGGSDPTTGPQLCMCPNDVTSGALEGANSTLPDLFACQTCEIFDFSNAQEFSLSYDSPQYLMATDPVLHYGIMIFGMLGGIDEDLGGEEVGSISIGSSGFDIGEEEFEHVIDGHTLGGSDLGNNSVFLGDAQDVAGLIQNSQTNWSYAQINGNFAYVNYTNNAVGILGAVSESPGQFTNVYTVIVNPSGGLVTAFPGFPGQQ